MTALDELNTAFLEAHPAEAARELDLHPTLPVAQLLQGSPARIVAPVLAEMQPPSAADLLRCCEVERARLLIGRLSAPRASAILRRLPEGLRNDLLGSLPGAMAIACRALLRFPVDAVGAHMDTGIPMLADQATVSEALAVLRDSTVECDGVIVVDDARRLAGWASVTALLRADGALSLRAACTTMASVPALMPVVAARQSTATESGHVIAVTDAARRPLGAITSGVLARAASTPAPDAPVDSGSTLAFLATQYWRAVTGLADVAVGMIVPVEVREP